MPPPGKDDIQTYSLAFQRGEEKGFNYFFTTLYPSLLYYAYRITRDKYAAEEIVEDSFLKIWERHANIYHPRVIKSWLYTTVRHAGIDWLKYKQRMLILKEDFAQLQKDNVELSFEQEIIYVETAHEVFKHIRLLPARCQEVFRLLFIEGKSLKEAATEMGLSVNTIKNQRSRGLKLLRKRIPALYTVFPFLFIT